MKKIVKLIQRIADQYEDTKDGSSPEIYVEYSISNFGGDRQCIMVDGEAAFHEYIEDAAAEAIGKIIDHVASGRYIKRD